MECDGWMSFACEVLCLVKAVGPSAPVHLNTLQSHSTGPFVIGCSSPGAQQRWRQHPRREVRWRPGALPQFDPRSVSQGGEPCHHSRVRCTVMTHFLLDTMPFPTSTFSFPSSTIAVVCVPWLQRNADDRAHPNPGSWCCSGLQSRSPACPTQHPVSPTLHMLCL